MMSNGLAQKANQSDRKSYAAGYGFKKNGQSKATTLQIKDEATSALPTVKQSRATLMTHDNYQKGDSKKVTSPTQAGYLNLRIKSSKAFPMSEVGMIEELLGKVKKIKGEGRQVNT